MLGYKVLYRVGRRLVSKADSRQSGPAVVGENLTMTGKGVFLSPNCDYVLAYYSDGPDAQDDPHVEEVLLTLSFDPREILSGNLTDREAEVSVRSARIVAIEPTRRRNPVDRSIRWYHGTTEASAIAALARGQLWGQPTAGRAWQAPLAGRAYLTRSLADAIIYGFGGVVAGRDPPPYERYKARGAVLEVVPGADCVPDEDWIGHALNEHIMQQRYGDNFVLHPELLPVGQAVMSALPRVISERFRNTKRHNLYLEAAMSRRGKTAIRALEKTAYGRALLASLAAQAPNVACDEASTRVARGWSFDRQDAKRFDPSGANFFEMATPLHAGEDVGDGLRLPWRSMDDDTRKTAGVALVAGGIFGVLAAAVAWYASRKPATSSQSIEPHVHQSQAPAPSVAWHQPGWKPPPEPKGPFVPHT